MSFWDAARFLARELASGQERRLDRDSAKRAAVEALVRRCGSNADDDTVQWVASMVPFVERWRDSGLPHVSFDETLAASLCNTALPVELVRAARIPFGCFGLSVPPSVFDSPVDMFIMGAKQVGKVHCMVHVPDGFAFGEEVDLADLAETEIVTAGRSEDEARADKLTMRAFGRLVTGVVLEMSSTRRGTLSEPRLSEEKPQRRAAENAEAVARRRCCVRHRVQPG